MALGKAGADRQEMHERLRGHAMAAWEATRAGEANPLAERIAADADLQRYLSAEELRSLMNASGYTGDAPQRARELAAGIHYLFA
jgi:adenylosuccinate lyase